MRYIFNNFDANTRQYQQPRISDFDHWHVNNDLRILAVLCHDLIPVVFGPIGQNDVMHVQVLWAGMPRPEFEVRSAVRDIRLVGDVPVTDIVDDYKRNFRNPNTHELQLLVNIYKYE